MKEPVLTIVDAEVDGRTVDVRVEGGVIAAVGPSLPRARSYVADAAGGALLPGLHDHHIHLLALAAAERSVPLGAGAVDGPEAFDAAVAARHARHPRGAWLRGVGYDEVVAGPLDRHRLDRLAPGRPIRVQHRSGAMWVLSSAALDELGVITGAGVERDQHGEPTGALHRLDTVISERIEPVMADLSAVGTMLSRFGVTGVTDATPFDDEGGFRVLARARAGGKLPQKVTVMGGPGVAATCIPAGLGLGPVKIVVADNALPTVVELVAAYGAARAAGRSVAVHCVTRLGLVLAMAAWEEVRPMPGDRIEHGSVIPFEMVARIADLRIAVVTQPGFIADRGDGYLANVDRDDIDGLYRCRSLIDAGVDVGGSTDAPFGPVDPWLAIRSAIDRRTASGAAVGSAEALAPRQALGLFLTAADSPGGIERRIEPGATADLCLLGVPLAEALAAPSADLVRGCVIDGALVSNQ